MDPFFALVPGVPINRNAIKKVQKEIYSSPSEAMQYRNAMHVGLLHGEDLQAQRGKLRLLSPDEAFFALIFELDAVIASEPGEEMLEQWQTLIKSWTFVVEAHPTLQDLYWRSINLRESVGTDYDIVYRSPIQRAFEVINFKLDHEARNPQAAKLSAPALYQEWVRNVKFSTLCTGERAFKQGFVDACVTVYNRILSIKPLRDLILAQEEKFGKDSCWSSIYQLEEICKKCGTGADSRERLLWVVSGIQDQIENGVLQTTSLSLRNLKGQGHASNKGTVDLFIFKLGIKNYALSTWLDEAGSAASSICRTTLQEALGSFEGYRKFFGTKEQRETWDMSWLGTLSPSMRQYSDFIEDAVYTAKHERKVKSALAAGARPADLPDREEFAADFKAFRDAWKKERGEQPEAAAEVDQAGL